MTGFMASRAASAQDDGSENPFAGAGGEASAPSAPENPFAATALPSDDVTPRSPGFELPADAGAGSGGGASSNPFAPRPVEITKTPEQIEAEIRQQAFNAALTGLIPMRPEEIRNLLKRYDQTRQAVETPVYPYPKPEIVVQDIVLDPGTTPAVLKLATGHVTMVNFVDITGEPWPIQDISWAGNFEIIKSEPGSNRLGISPMSDYAYGNISVQLLEMKTPVSFTLETQRELVHYRFDARIGQRGPYAKPGLIEASTPVSLSAGGWDLNAVLEGVPPSSSERLQVEGVDGRTTAYMIGGLTYVRTPLMLLSPSWSSSVSSADGMNVYTIKNAPVLLLSDNGQVVRARLSERDFTHDE
ncbi:MAG: type IV secretion protein DotH [Micavibrio aeruginosavorus]|uniref:Type IV secretion protein DotH n=1 Tax=Micavibrio aeruginosavorus TaxID=349221 RepID=A0A7T5R2S4_9BACT|nr:MAG: type IV secretion protein DotH [Micavibrio aeruginosavorus]